MFPGEVRSLSFVSCPRAISDPIRALLVILSSSIAPLGPLGGFPVIYRREIRIIQYAWSKAASLEIFENLTSKKASEPSECF